jgi:DNA polymerase zeta
MAKKRYVGFKYENPDDKEPTFDAKGIETVRRDGIPAQQKMVENCLKCVIVICHMDIMSLLIRILFRRQDLSQVKEYCWRSWIKILENRASIQDFIFAKEVHMGSYR